MNKHLFQNSKGFTIMELMVSLGITAIATMGLFTVLQMYYSANSRSNTRSAVVDTELDAYFIQENLAEWIGNVVDATKPKFFITELSKCFKISGAVCPSALDSAALNSIKDPELQSYISLGKIISTVPLKNLQGDPIAGTLDAPVYYSPSGQKVTAADQAAFSLSGVMVRDNATGSPGKVVLLIRAAAVSSPANASTPLRTRWIRINVGSRWELISAEIFGACSAGEYVVAVDNATGAIVCKSLSQQCATNQYVGGINAAGKIQCIDLPANVTPRPYTPPAQIACDSFGHSTASCTIPGGKTIAAVTVAERRSRAGCSIGSDVTFSGSTITVSGGCRATFNVMYNE